jgi:hypothetical protein
MTIYTELAEAIERGAAERVAGRTRDVLDDVVTGRLRISAVSHPLGFVCLPVYRFRDQGVCIHLWAPQWRHDSLTTSPTHCHSWELLSWVLVGELRNQTLRVDDGAATPTHRIFEVRSGAHGDEIRATPRLVRTEVAGETTYRAGESYQQPAGVFHQTIVSDAESPVATVALGATRPGAVDLSLGGIRTGTHRVRRQLRDARDTVRAAEAVRRALVPPSG